MIRSLLAFLICGSIGLAPLVARAAVDLPLPSTSGTLVEETLSRTPADPHHWDWRDEALQVELGYGSVQEYNSFKSTSYGLALSRPLFGPWLMRGAIRRVETEATASSRLFAQTPFSQAAQPSRWEFLIGGGFALLDGRSATALSPRITDVGHVLYVIGGLQYNHFASSDPEPVPGMRAIEYTMALETGLHLQIDLPHSLGLGAEWTYSIPLGGRDPDLTSWQRLSGILAWSFGR